MRIAMTGASGLVGRTLRRRLGSAGHAITRLVRDEAAARAPDAALWSPARGTIDAVALEAHDAVIHLAGESLFGLWTRARKDRIRRSRVEGTALLARALAGLERPPKVLVSASGVNYYGDRPGEVVDEDSPPGRGFLPEVVIGWEAATRPATEAGIRTILLRSGIVLTPRGGALGLMLPIFRLGLGGRVGDGRQPFPWITLDDLAAVVESGLKQETMSGPLNLVAPQAVSMGEFVDTLARVLHRPAIFALPAGLARLVAGDMADELLLHGATVRPRRLEEAGYRFLHPELEPALREMLA